VYLSLTLDLPTGAPIIVQFGVVLVLMAIVRVLVLDCRRRRSACSVGRDRRGRNL
jgi:hypothetical protein